MNPRNAEALSGLGHVYENSGHQSEAEAAFIKAAALRPDFWDGYDELGLYYDRQTKYPQAVQQLLRAVELTPDNAQVYSNLGAVYIDWGDVKVQPEAEKALKKSIELTPSYPAFANLGSLYYNQKRYAEAASMFEAALKINDRNYQVWQFLTNAYTWMKDEPKLTASRDKTLALLEPYVKLRPQDAQAQANLATIYAEKNLRDKATMRLQSALALAPDDPVVLQSAGVVWEILGDRARAITFIEKSQQKGNGLQDLTGDPDLQSLLRDPNLHINPK